MDEITIGDKVYVSSKRAAKITGYAKDYVGQLCREGRVEARLVGRNWYVLESSIREHRFGASDQSMPKEIEMPASPASSWGAPRYESISAPEMPIIAPRPVASTAAEAPEPVVPAVPEKLQEVVEEIHSEKVVEDMQAAWRDWFNRAENLNQNSPNGTEDYIPEDLPLTGGMSETYEESIEESAEETVIVSRIHAPQTTQEEILEDSEEETVPLYRSHASRVQEEREKPRTSAPVVDLTPARRLPKERKAPRAVAHKEQEANEEGSGIVLKAVFISIAVLAAATAFIGSGYANSLFGTHASKGVQPAIVDYLQGASTVNK